MELNYLRNILEDLTSRFSERISTPTNFLKRELFNLKEYERALIKKRIIDLNYDVGCTNVLILLKQAQILTTSEYLGNIKDSSELVPIITDIFDDSGNCKELIEEILNEDRFSEQVNECFRNYIEDCIENQQVIKNEMISSLEAHISTDVFLGKVLPIFLRNLMHHNYESCFDPTTALSEQQKWNEKFHQLKLISDLIEKLMRTQGAKVIEILTDLIQSNSGSNWFFILMTIGKIPTDTEQHRIFKKYIDSMFKTFRDNGNTNVIFKSLLLARQLLFYANSEEEKTKSKSYKQWLKCNVGEFNYTIKDKPARFFTLIETLENLVSYENDCGILDIHISVPISAPSKEYSHILEYKKLLQTRRDSLLENE